MMHLYLETVPMPIAGCRGARPQWGSPCGSCHRTLTDEKPAVLFLRLARGHLLTGGKKNKKNKNPCAVDFAPGDHGDTHCLPEIFRLRKMHNARANVPSAAARRLHASVMKRICIAADGDQNKCIIHGPSQAGKVERVA